MRQMDKLESNLTSCLQARMEKARLSWADLSRESVEIVIFGSRAVGMGRRASDLDILAVGNSASRIKRFGIDLISIPAGHTASPRWLSSELAGHIARYGVWLKGSGVWREHVFVGREAAAQKERRLVSLVRSVKHSWAKLHPAFQLKYRVTIRRELQRLILLQAAVPIPPTRVLDLEWRSRNSERNPFVNASTPILYEAGEFTLRKDLG
jgi:Nucleotidyltransferase domain